MAFDIDSFNQLLRMERLASHMTEAEVKRFIGSDAHYGENNGNSHNNNEDNGYGENLPYLRAPTNGGPSNSYGYVMINGRKHYNVNNPRNAPKFVPVDGPDMEAYDPDKNPWDFMNGNKIPFDTSLYTEIKYLQKDIDACLLKIEAKKRAAEYYLRVTPKKRSQGFTFARIIKRDLYIIPTDLDLNRLRNLNRFFAKAASMGLSENEPTVFGVDLEMGYDDKMELLLLGEDWRKEYFNVGDTSNIDCLEWLLNTRRIYLHKLQNKNFNVKRLVKYIRKDYNREFEPEVRKTYRGEFAELHKVQDTEFSLKSKLKYLNIKLDTIPEYPTNHCTDNFGSSHGFISLVVDLTQQLEQQDKKIKKEEGKILKWESKL